MRDFDIAVALAAEALDVARHFGESMDGNTALLTRPAANRLAAVFAILVLIFCFIYFFELASFPFSLDEVRIGYDGQVREYDSSNATLTWTPSHHNWEDSATIDTGTTVFTLTAMDYGHAYNITASGGETWGPIRLDPWVP